MTTTATQAAVSLLRTTREELDSAKDVCRRAVEQAVLDVWSAATQDQVDKQAALEVELSDARKHNRIAISAMERWVLSDKNKSGQPESRNVFKPFGNPEANF
ncbi:unnamed protein product [Polarella glacialis]|uniref:Uncharacterized protein n=1 Tax=Polarella glacialis TaxID=89957 RepID=A0A813FJ29_POLGL|nr:unnamed protein product [Polarella glacialis]